MVTEKINLDHGFLQSVPLIEFKNMSFDLSKDFPKIKIEIKN